ncbi:hypothetical protein [Cohnella algarum]|uniref:hypothetical protein n=1 Tax=Cohnella algarum TaxID=2044859 RepID=UPI00196835E0|nr:hypothetical protein [Cohnella algarum]MBN2984264.1 hypothetical protein [Cohnella algarum]
MDLIDKELEQQLAGDPLRRHGFDERLRRRIEERLDGPARNRKEGIRFGWKGAGAALAAVVLVAAGIGLWNGSDLRSVDQASPTASVSASGEPVEALAANNETIASALLIGIRNDENGDGASSYRTVLVAPEENKLEVVAEGDGILMPYRQDFWKIEAIQPAEGSDSQLLRAYKAEGKAASERIASPVTAREAVVEKLLYAGNQYVSLSKRVLSPERDAEADEYFFVKNVEQLTANLQTVFEPSLEPFAAFEDVAQSVPTAEKEPAISRTVQWSIVREPGQWVAVGFAGSESLRPVDADTSEEIAVALPETVVQSDELALSWEQIRQIEPKAEDAFTSPREDVLAVVLPNEIDVYPYKQKSGQSVTLALAPTESVVMVQWAASESYVESWKQRVADILADGGAPDRS